jgi:hypothetical protein
MTAMLSLPVVTSVTVEVEMEEDTCPNMFIVDNLDGRVGISFMMSIHLYEFFNIMFNTVLACYHQDTMMILTMLRTTTKARPYNHDTNNGVELEPP